VMILFAHICLLDDVSPKLLQARFPKSWELLNQHQTKDSIKKTSFVIEKNSNIEYSEAAKMEDSYVKNKTSI